MMIFSHYLFIYTFFCHMAFGILVPWAGIEPTPPVEETQSPNHWSGKSHKDRFKGLWRRWAGAFFLEGSVIHWMAEVHTTKQKGEMDWERKDQRAGNEGGCFLCYGSGLSAADSPSAGQRRGQGGASGAVCNFGVMSLSFCDLWQAISPEVNAEGREGVCFQAAKTSQQVKLTQPRRSLIRA